MIDLHTHILPGLDDGVSSYEEAVNTAREALGYGISHLVATPHILPGIYQNDKAAIYKKLNNLQQLLEQQKVAVTIHPGAEYYIEPELPIKMDKGELLTLNNHSGYLLMELPPFHIPYFWEDVLFRLQLKGVTPVLAHPERNAVLRRYPEILERIISRGILLQITAGSLFGLYGREVLNYAEIYIRKGWVHFVSSDLHGSGKRLLAMKDVGLKLCSLVGEKKARQILYDNPLSVLQIPKTTGRVNTFAPG